MLKDRLVVLTEEEYEAQARKQVPAEVIVRTQGALIGWQNADEFDTEELQEHGDVLRDATRALLAAVEAAPDEERLTEAPAKHRFAEWCGENFAAIWYEFSLLRDELGLPQPECDEEASSTDPTPDFASMSAATLSLEEVQALRDWLDERGRLYEGRATGEEVLFHAWFGGGGTVGAGSGSTREAALLALCQAVAAKEGS